MTFDQFWQECLSLAKTQNQVILMNFLKNLYYDAWEEGKSPEEFMEEEWG